LNSKFFADKSAPDAVKNIEFLLNTAESAEVKPRIRVATARLGEQSARLDGEFTLAVQIPGDAAAPIETQTSSAPPQGAITALAALFHPYRHYRLNSFKAMAPPIVLYPASLGWI
jgi:hypothetical protein